MNNRQRLFWLTGVWALLLPTGAMALPGTEAVPSPQSATQHLAQLAPELPAPTVSQITGVSVNPAGDRLQITFTATGPLAAGEPSVVGNAIVTEIPNAVLVLPEGESFQQLNPTAGIAEVQVSNLANNRVQVSITGTEAAPTATVNSTEAGLAFSIAPGSAQAEAELQAPDPVRITVVGEQDDGYNPSTASTATGFETPLRDIPQSIQVIPQAVIEDRNAVELGDALETAGSVVSRGGRGTSVFGPGFLIRGFPVEEGIFRDGVETFSLAPLDTNDVEQIEVLKGPASVLFGQGDPGGIINLVSKQPLSEPFYEFSATVGNFSRYRGDVDLSGPLNDARSLRYRLNLTYSNFGSFRDFVNGERVLVSPTLTWDIGPNTSLNLYGQYAYNRETIDEGIPFTAAGPVDVPRSRFIGEDFGELSQDQFTVGYRLNHKLNDDWSIRHNLQYLQYHPRRYAPLYDFFDETTGDIDRLEYFAGGQYRRLFTNAEVLGQFKTGSVLHKLLFGVEYRNVLEQPEFQFSNLYTPINVFNPVYTRVPYAIAPEFFRDDTIETVGVYIQDQIELLSNLKLLAGIRYDYVDQFRTTQDLGAPREEFTQTDSAFSPGWVSSISPSNQFLSTLPIRNPLNPVLELVVTSMTRPLPRKPDGSLRWVSRRI